ncbi:unnamed protein product, partial [Ilex paraguariensis]
LEAETPKTSSSVFLCSSHKLSDASKLSTPYTRIMEIIASKPKIKSQQRLPPRRGQIKLRIFKAFARSVVAVITMAGDLGIRKRKKKGNVSSELHETPSVFNSDTHSNG